MRESLAALRWLRAAGARQCYFKYCSTFDSTPQGNIGPVAEALMDALGADFTIACPAFPENGRTVFRGHLFVGDVLLSDSGMRTHPLTPMTDANLVRVLQAQCRGSVGLLRHDVVAQGAEAVRAAFDALRSDGVRIAVADAVDNDDLRTLARACADLPLVTAGSGVALGLPDAYAARGWLTPDAQAAALPAVGGLAAVVSGSCSSATNAQVAHWLASGRAGLQDRRRARSRPARRWRRRRCRGRASGCPKGRCWSMPRRCRDEVAQVQQRLGAARAGALVERCLADVAQGLVAAGVRRLVVAGGETSGAVVQALGVHRLAIGAPIDPGVPWTQAEGRPAAAGAEVGQLRRRRTSSRRRWRRRHEVDTHARRDLPRRQVALRARLRPRHRRQHQRAPARRRLPHHAHRRLPRPPRPRGALARRRAGRAAVGRARRARRSRCTARIYEADPAARCVIHTHSTHLVALTLAGVWSADDIVPPITPYFVMKVGHVPLVPYHRPGDPAVAATCRRGRSPRRASAARRSAP